jgi:hypothetical protein
MTHTSPDPTAIPMRTGSAALLWLDGEAIPVNIAETDADVMLVPLAQIGHLLDRRRPGLLLESVSSRGLVRARGAAVRIDPDLVRFEVEGAPQVVQRRQFVRVVAPQRVELDDLCGQVAKMHPLNISGGGMLVSGPTTLPVDAETHFCLFLGDLEPPVTGVGRVIRAAEEQQQRAIVFESIDHRDRERLIRFIFDRQRAALAITRGDAV